MNIEYAESADDVAAQIAAKLNHYLEADKKVLWLVSGGSAITPAALASMQLKNTSNLAVMQVDERYGDTGHQDSNWRQIIESGFVFGDAAKYPVLTGQDAKTTFENFARNLEEQLKSADFAVGLFGAGKDHHSAGILPESIAATTKDLAEYYEADDYKRITITPAAIAMLDKATLYLFGAEKAHVLEGLATDFDPIQQPVQFLKKAKSFTIYTDIKEAVA